tara:strand:- start:275 stop:496 length:222 start_codon:yes stop_codon:yes gene_type:complete
MIKIIGFAFIIFGIIWAILDRIMCKGLCNVCTSDQLSPCFFLFLFVGVIFVIAGYSLVNMQQNNLPKVKLKKK